MGLTDSLNTIHFPNNSEVTTHKPLTNDLLHSLLEKVYTALPPFTGYLTFAGTEGATHFLFFAKGKPFGAGRCGVTKPVFYSMHDLGMELAKADRQQITVTLCETDPVLLKGMQLFLQKEPQIKATTDIIDFEAIVSQIVANKENAMIALVRGDSVNLFFFKDGQGAVVYYADQSFERPEGMTIDEEMMLYAFQPGDPVQAYLYRDLSTPKTEDASIFDRDSLYTLLTVGYLEKRRRRAVTEAPAPEQTPPKASCDTKARTAPDRIVLMVESGPQKGDCIALTLPCMIGRQDCDVTIDDRLISRRHAVIKLVDNHLEIEDLDSRNGTRVNGSRITSSPLKPLDLISIGTTDLRIQTPVADAPH